MSKVVGPRIAPANLLSQMLSTVGDGSGTTNMIRSTTTVYKVVPPAGKRYHIARINVHVGDGVNEKFSADIMVRSIEEVYRDLLTGKGIRVGP